ANSNARHIVPPLLQNPASLSTVRAFQVDRESCRNLRPLPQYRVGIDLCFHLALSTLSVAFSGAFSGKAMYKDPPGSFEASGRGIGLGWRSGAAQLFFNQLPSARPDRRPMR